MADLKMFMLGAMMPLAFYFLIVLLFRDDNLTKGKKMDCCDYECNEGHNCPVRRTPLTESQKQQLVCPPCHGDCYQGRNCPTNKEKSNG
jgi:hypothetical protein